MFTGIIEAKATIAKATKEGSNITFTMSSGLAPQLKIDQSLAHNGVCLTVTSIEGELYTVTAVDETLRKTNAGSWTTGERINLERAMLAGARLDGHFVQGHVDCKASCTVVKALEGSWLYDFQFPIEFAALVIEKGSICINGVSLTIFNVGKDTFSVTIIPYTFEHTNFNQLKAGDTVNLEFDVLGKYCLRQMEVSRWGK